MKNFAKYYGDKRLKGSFKTQGLTVGNYYEIIKDIDEHYLEVLNDDSKKVVYDKRLFEEHTTSVENSSRIDNCENFEYKDEKYVLSQIPTMDMVVILKEPIRDCEPYEYVNYVHGQLGDTDTRNSICDYIDEYINSDCSLIEFKDEVESTISKIADSYEQNIDLNDSDITLSLSLNGKTVTIPTYNVEVYESLLNLLDCKQHD